MIEEASIKGLLKAMRDRDTTVREIAARELGAIRNPESIPILVEALDSQETFIRQQVARVLGHIEHAQAVEPLLNVLNDPDDRVRHNAAKALVNIAKTNSDTAVPDQIARAMIDQLSHGMVAVRYRAAGLLSMLCLENMAAATRPAVPALIEALSDENAAVRREVISALGLIGDKRAIPSLINLVRDQAAELGPSAAISLSRIGSPAVPELTALLQNEPEPVRYLAVEALGLIGRAALPSLFAAIQDQSHYVRNQAALALGLIGKENPDLVIRITPYLIDLLADDNDFVRHNACQLLAEIHDPELVDQLVTQLAGDSLVARYRAVLVLAQLSRIGHPDIAPALLERAVPALINTLEDSNSAVRRESAAALGQIGSQSQDVGARVAPVLLSKLTDIDLRTHWSAASALGRIGTAALPSLTEALQDKNRDVRFRAVWALGNIGEPAVPALVSALDDLDPRVRERAVTALGQIAGEDSVPALIDCLQDVEGEIQQRAAWALTRIDTKDAQEAVKMWREAKIQEHLG